MPVRETYVESYKEKTSIKPQELMIGVKRDSMLYWSQVYNDTTSQLKLIEPIALFKLKQFITNSDISRYLMGERTCRLDRLSYQIYGTPYLWWVIKLLNPDIFTTPFSFVEAGTTINIVPFDKVLEILQKLS